MKLRMQSNSIRLRLKRGEVEALATTGRVEEKITFGVNETFQCVLESSRTVSAVQAILKDKEILVRVPADKVVSWAFGEDVGIEAVQPVGEDGKLQVLVEKDFACLTGPPEENIDTFPNPLAGARC